MSVRQSARLSAKPLQTATVGLAASLVAIRITHSAFPSMTQGIGRIVRDGRSFFLAVDVATLSAHQGRGVRR